MSMKILVVDDSPTERFFITDLLTRHGYAVVTAENGAEAVTKARAEKPSLIVMDVVMPGLSGFQATRAMSKDPDVASIPVVLCSTKGTDSDRVWGLRQGAREYLTKPVNPTELLAKIKALV